jgi:DNA gyrase subunit A
VEDSTTGNVIPVAIEDEIKTSYLNYAMSVIVSRALPDVRDGLKPVHRRILFAMHEMGLRSDRSFKKCGRIVGDVLGKYHPHGDQSIYDALVRLAQEFSMRYPVVNGQGNFGSVDGDPAAAMRYTEAKMQRIAEEMIKDIRKETVDFGPNYDDSLMQPTVLPAAFPYLLVNGSSGIAVGMATNIPPHNLNEVVDAISAYIENPDIEVDALAQHIQGPDFPTGGIIYGKRGVREAYRTGRGKVTVRAKCVLETTKAGKDVIVVQEIPYTVNKANLVVKIADLVNDKKIEGISDLRDESDRNGMRIVIELKRGAIPKIVLNQLFAHTALQSNFNVNNLALVDGRPKLLNLKQTIYYYVEHRKEVVIRRSEYDLRKAEEREHILIGLKIALENIDEVVETIKSSANVEEARSKLRSRFELSEVQAQAILDMRLQKLTSLETQKILDELAEIRALIAYLKELLASEEKILAVVRDELLEVAEKFGDERRTDIVPDEIEQLDIEDLIQKEDMVVLISNKGFIKRISTSSYKKQGRGGKGSSATKLKTDDFMEHLFIASTHDYILFVSSEGKAYWLKVHEIPEASKASRGSAIKALISVGMDEDITATVSLKEFSEEEQILMATQRGVVKKVPTNQFVNAKTRGIIAIKLDDGDKLVSAKLTTGDDEIMLISKKGNALRFHENAIRPMGRASRGVQGIKLQKEDELAAALIIQHNCEIFLISEFGYGKRCAYDNFTPHGRATKGQTVYKVTEKTGELVTALSVQQEDELICISSQGNAVKLSAKQVPVIGRNAFGVRVVNITPPDYVVATGRVVAEEDEEEE